MSTLILLGYATRYGSTQEVAEAVAITLHESGLEVDVQPLREVRTPAGYRAKEPASDLRDWTAIHAWVSNPTQKLVPALP